MRTTARTAAVTSAGPTRLQTTSAILVSVIAITVIVLACRWLWQSVGAGVLAVLALAVPFSLPAVTATLHEAMDEAPPGS